MNPRLRQTIARFLSHYGMLGVLVLLACFFSLVTLQEQHPAGAAAARSLLSRLPARPDDPQAPDAVLIVARAVGEDGRFGEQLASGLRARGYRDVETFLGEPGEIRAALARWIEARSEPPARLAIATPHAYAAIARAIQEDFPPLSGAQVLTPGSYRWPTFLLAENLLNVANQIAVIAIVAIGMTMVIIAGGIDLSVGSLIALAAVLVAGFVGHLGGAAASGWAMLAAAVAAILAGCLVGAFSGIVITRFRVPPFIATLGMMQVASGLAYILSQGRPIYQLPDRFVGLGRGADPLVGIPYAVLLMALLYVAAHLLMSRTPLGRYIYAVGGNAEAARLAGVDVRAVLMFVYIVSAGLAGLGGVMMASQLKSGAPTYGLMYELYVIAAVVVGGTSLSGGEGRILGTLIGAFIIAVIQNGMNLTNVESYTQKVVLGLVILGAVLLDRSRHAGWFRRRGAGRSPG
ncbi:MAG: ABC transporter permease [Candidatus Eisenbacteria bacterium]